MTFSSLDNFKNNSLICDHSVLGKGEGRLRTATAGSGVREVRGVAWWEERGRQGS